MQQQHKAEAGAFVLIVGQALLLMLFWALPGFSVETARAYFRRRNITHLGNLDLNYEEQQTLFHSLPSLVIPRHL